MEHLPKNTPPIIEGRENNIEKSHVKDGVDFVFEQHPELAEIGTKEQYSEYLKTVFPESKVKDIVYHGTNINSYNAILEEGFDLNKSGSHLGYIGEIASFFNEKGFTNSFEAGAVVSALLNITSEYIDNFGNLSEDGLIAVKQKILDLGIIPWVKNMEKLDREILLSNNARFDNARDTIRLGNYLGQTIKNSNDINNSILSELKISGLKRNNEVIDMLSQHQIYVLGSVQDLKNFEKFTDI